MVVLGSRREITLETFERVAWRGERVRIAPEALARVAAAREAFLRLAARPDVTIYGVTSGYGDRAGRRLDENERREQAVAAHNRGASFGEPLPERVARGIVVARLANLVDGYAAVSPELVEATAALLDGDPLPRVPVQGNGGSGEILALGHLFGPLIETFRVGEKEGLALINGSPCAAALVADAALAARRRLQLAHDVFALSVEAFAAPLEAYDRQLEQLWGDEHETRALQELRSRLEPTARRGSHQAPVAFRILPRVLGQTGRAVAEADQVAAVSLSSVTDNPVYLPPDEEFPDGRVLSTGGYHNAASPSSLHRLAVCWADLCQLAERHVEQLVHSRQADTEAEVALGLLMMVVVAFSEEARAHAQPPILPRGGRGQNDVTSPAFLAWSRAENAARSLDASLAVLAAAAAARLGERDVHASLHPLRAQCGPVVAALESSRAAGVELERLTARLRERIVPAGQLPVER
jgi:histidine ammonia-lyase